MGVYIEPGYKVGRLTVRKLVVDGNANQRRWLCDCECGGTKITSEDNLKRGSERMGIYLPNMEMPKKQVCVVLNPNGLVEILNSDNILVEEFYAVPVPPHGKLIDADAILQEATKGEEPFDWIDKNELLRLFFDAPTIIPAEEKQL